FVIVLELNWHADSLPLGCQRALHGRQRRWPAPLGPEARKMFRYPWLHVQSILQLRVRARRDAWTESPSPDHKLGRVVFLLPHLFRERSVRYSPADAARSWTGQDARSFHTWPPSDGLEQWRARDRFVRQY